MKKIIIFLTLLLLVKSHQMQAQVSMSDSSNLLPNGMTPQKVQNPIALNPKTISQLLAMDAMQTPGIRQFGPQGKLNAKRFWLVKFTSSKKNRMEYNRSESRNISC